MSQQINDSLNAEAEGGDGEDEDSITNEVINAKKEALDEHVGRFYSYSSQQEDGYGV